MGADWPVVGGNLGNTRYSSLDQVNTTNVTGLKAAWMIHLGSGLSTGTPPYTLEATPVGRRIIFEKARKKVLAETGGAEEITLTVQQMRPLTERMRLQWSYAFSQRSGRFKKSMGDKRTVG